ncbi:Uncharacterised protein [Candidatus Anstonella stagnisolia]|nr:Uncharacterised protein [Candidatus Anstonella stagnisolia]
MKNANAKILFIALFAFILMAGSISAASLTLYQGWNMITPGDDGLTASAISNSCSQTGSIWHYDGSNYQRASGTLEAGKGYWVRVNSQCTVNTYGSAYTVTSLSMNSGWNQIGIPSSTGSYSSSSTCSIQGGPWYYDTSSNSYQRSDISSLIAGRGYWVKASSSCTLYFGDTSPPQPPSEDNTGALSYISTYASNYYPYNGQAVSIDIYAYDTDGSYATAQEGTSVSGSVDSYGRQGYSLSGFTYGSGHFSATFSASEAGSYTINVVAAKNGVQKTRSITISYAVQPPLGYISYWYGKVNMHRERYGSWQTDSDRTSGADINQLTYCQKFFPGSIGVNETSREYISSWKDVNGTSYSGYGITYACLATNYYRVVTDLKGDDEAQRGTVTFTSSPSSASVVVSDYNGNVVSRGTTPYSAQLQYGSYRALFTMDHFDNYTYYLYVNDRTETANAYLYQTRPLGYIAYWQGKVNMHTSQQYYNGNNWLSDDNAGYGANTDQLDYCKRFYPQTQGVNETTAYYIYGWRNANGNTVNGYGIVYACLPYEYKNIVTDLAPHTQGTAMHIYDELSTDHYKAALYDVSAYRGAYAASIDIYDSLGTRLTSVYVVPGSNYTYAARRANYSLDIKVYSVEPAAGKGMGYRWADVAVSESQVQPPQPSLDYATVEGSNGGRVNAGSPLAIRINPVDTDGSIAIPDEGTAVSATVGANGMGGYSLGQFTYSEGLGYFANFLANQSGTYTISATARKNGVERTARTTIYVQPVTLGQIAYWYGKVNQHRTPNGQWQTDNDGASGADLATLGYCQKFFPQTNYANNIGSVYINGWKNNGNEGFANGTGTLYNCVQ